MMKTIGIVGGYWSTNIGNSFFQLGAEQLLRAVYPQHRVLMLSDQPGYASLGRKKTPKMALQILDKLSLDYLVVLGPFLRRDYKWMWLDVMRELVPRGVKVIALGAGMMDYSVEAVRTYREWLSETPFYAFASRDRATYQNIQDLVGRCYDGIDLAFLISDYYSPPKMTADQFVVYNFDKSFEPQVLPAASQRKRSRRGTYFELNGITWCVDFPFGTEAVSRSKFLQLIHSWLPQRAAAKMGDMQIYRTDHCFNPVTLRNIYNKPNTFVSDLPETYLTLYANAPVTLSNRVHACIASLAYGNHAMLFSSTPRARLLDRVGANEIQQHPVAINQARLTEEKSGLVSFVRSLEL